MVGAVLLHQLSELPPEGHMNTSQRPVSDSLLKDPRHNLKPSPCGGTEGIKDISVQDFNSHVKNIKELLITAKPVMDVYAVYFTGLDLKYPSVISS